MGRFGGDDLAGEAIVYFWLMPAYIAASMNRTGLSAPT
jgi:hypothetical protein